jgi:hypothetical protein
MSDDNPHKDKKFKHNYDFAYKGEPLKPYQAPRYLGRKRLYSDVVWSVDADKDARYVTKVDIGTIVLLDGKKDVKLLKLGVFLAKIQDGTGYTWEVPKVRVFKKQKKQDG